MANLLTTTSVLMCPHGGTVTVTTQNSQVMTAGSPLVRASDTFVIAGCSLASLPTPSPCVQIKWVQPDSKSQARDDFTLSESSVGMCLSGTMIPQGSVLINFTQAEGSGR
jgi:hypothetical protein